MSDKIQQTAHEQLGNKLIEVLNLKVKKNGRVDTQWGDKTPIGLGATVARIVKETLGNQL